MLMFFNKNFVNFYQKPFTIFIVKYIILLKYYFSNFSVFISFTQNKNGIYCVLLFTRKEVEDNVICSEICESVNNNVSNVSQNLFICPGAICLEQCAYVDSLFSILIFLMGK